jgi:hypothetical protein
MNKKTSGIVLKVRMHLAFRRKIKMCQAPLMIKDVFVYDSSVKIIVFSLHVNFEYPYTSI